MPTAKPNSTAKSAPFLILHALLIPGALALAAMTAHRAGVDEHISAYFFDPVLNSFPARSSVALELIGHRFAKSTVAGLWLTLLAAALAAPVVAKLARVRALLWTAVVAMALGPSIVVLLKGINAMHCPWDLKRFGGYADFTSGWFVAPIEAGRCFPSGHASGGFSLIALVFAGTAIGNERLRAIGLIATLVAGSTFSIVRIAQGAHFLSHNLWAAAIDWCAAALVFAPLMMSRQICEPQAPAATPLDHSGPKLAPKGAPKGLRRLPLAAALALRGLRAAWSREAAFRQEVVVAAFLLPLALTASIALLERIALIVALLMVLIVELLNTAIEALVDLVSPTVHPLAAVAKDAAAAAVLLTLVLAGGIWLAVLLPVY